MSAANLFSGIPQHIPAELFTSLLEAPGVKIERIVSHGHASPPDFWYDQDRNEWVIVLTGAARLRFENDEQLIDMKPGDFVHIPAHRRHRVDWTALDEATVWLAVHYR
jgi:cupin 2 domain-containing protein